MAGIEEFKRELNDLLLKYQDLPEMTMTIRPRVSFGVSFPTQLPSQTQTPQVIPPVAGTPIKQPKTPITNVLDLEKSINPVILENIEKMTKIG